MLTKILLAVTAALLTTSCSNNPPVGEAVKPKAEKAPDIYKVKFETSKGPIVLEVHRDWSPLGADRFHELVAAKYLDGDRFFRVVKGFVVQFGINGDPKVTAKWKNTEIVDDPVKQTNARGTIVFATSGPNTRTTQLFINLADNARLDGMGFSPFGKVIEGMDVVDQIYGGYGEQPDQQMIETRGNDYLQSNFGQLDYIKTATLP